MRKVSLMCLVLLFLVACSSGFEPTLMATDSLDNNKYEVSAECKPYYMAADGKGFNIAVLNFVDNTSRPNTQIVTDLRENVETIFTRLGGFNIVPTDVNYTSRQFNDALARKNAVATFGADYVVAGSIDAINVSLTGGDCNGQKKCSYKVSSDMTISLYNVKAKEVVFTRQVSDAREAIYVSREPLSNEKIISFVQNSGIDSKILDPVYDEIIHYIPILAYVVDLRGDKHAVLIKNGQSSGIEDGTLFRPQEASVETDVLTGKTYCHLTPMPFTLKASGYVNETGTWLKPDTSDQRLLQLLKVGVLVKRISAGESASKLPDLF